MTPVSESARFPLSLSRQWGDTRQGIGHSPAIVTRVSSHIPRPLPANECHQDNKMMTMRNKSYLPRTTERSRKFPGSPSHGARDPRTAEPLSRTPLWTPGSVDLRLSNVDSKASGDELREAEHRRTDLPCQSVTGVAIRHISSRLPATGREEDKEMARTCTTWKSGWPGPCSRASRAEDHSTVSAPLVCDKTVACRGRNEECPYRPPGRRVRPRNPARSGLRQLRQRRGEPREGGTPDPPHIPHPTCGSLTAGRR
jgi:hypothetical protein